MDEKRKKRIKTVVEDTALFALLKEDKNSEKSFEDEELEVLEQTNETDSEDRNDFLGTNEKITIDQKTIKSSQKGTSIKTLISNNDYDDLYYLNENLDDDILLDEDELLEEIDQFDSDEVEDIVNLTSNHGKNILKKSTHVIGKTTVFVNRTTRTVRRLQEGEYTTDPNQLLKSMGKTAIAPVKRKVRNTVIKKTKKLIFRNPIARKINGFIKRLIKVIVKQIVSLLSILFIVSLPVVIVITLILSIFGMGGYDQSVITSYENYMMEINEKNKDRVDDYKSDNIFAEIYSSQGNEYGSVNWRAVISCIQILYGDNLSFSSKEKIFLKKLELSNLYERYEESEEIKITVNDDDEQVKVKVRVLTIVNPGIDEYINFLKSNYNISDLDEKAIKTLYVSPNLMDAFSPEISGKYGGGKVFDDEKIQLLFQEAEKYLGRPYVWGGSSPSTGFDCSGFVCYVYTKTKTYNLPRTTAQRIYNQCVPITETEAKPGDLIFFKGTYESSNTVTHIGIYAGDGLMLHCGDPIQYASYKTNYWQKHFYSFGRLK